MSITETHHSIAQDCAKEISMRPTRPTKTITIASENMMMACVNNKTGEAFVFITFNIIILRPLRPH
jgi:hypothetical protein